MRDILHPDFCLGILGGGQLGKMMLPFIQRTGIAVKFLDPDPHAPCTRFTPAVCLGDLQDKQAVLDFGKTCDILTIEIEKVNVEALKILEEQGVIVRPSAKIIEIVQDKLVQKKFLKTNGFATADFHQIDHREQLHKFGEFFPCVMKTRRDGYDGRGVQVLNSIDDLDKAFEQPSLIEKKIAFQKELAVLVARSPSGELSHYDPVEMDFHKDAHLVDFLIAPARISPTVKTKALEMASGLAESLGLVGIMAVEMFLTNNQELLVNELAPRPHNSGHHTIEANVTSQYEQHLRAILGLGLGDSKMLSPAVCINILGEKNSAGLADYSGLSPLLSENGLYVHVYGKKYTKAFRKMGHLTILDDDLDLALRRARELKPKMPIRNL